MIQVALVRRLTDVPQEALEDGLLQDCKTRECKPERNYSGMLIGRSIAILYFLARKITAEGAEERRAFNRLFPLRALCG